MNGTELSGLRIFLPLSGLCCFTAAAPALREQVRSSFASTGFAAADERRFSSQYVWDKEENWRFRGIRVQQGNFSG